MSVVTSVIPERLDALRNTFDLSFAEPPQPAASQVEDLLAVRVGSTSYAIRIAAISGLFADRVITPLPGPMPELLGVAGFRGSIVGVYDLSAILGHGQSVAPRWLVLDRGTPPMALAFDDIEGYERVPIQSITAASKEMSTSGTQLTSPHVTVQTLGGVRPVVAIVEVRAAIEARTRQVNDSRNVNDTRMRQP